MKLGIIGDCHLGASLRAGTKDSNGMYTRLQDYYNTLVYTINDMINAGCTVIVFTGDIFEHRYPTVLQQKLFSRALQVAVAAGIKQIHIVIGNHDQQRTSGTTTISYLKELKLDNIMVHEELGVLPVEDANLYFLPYRDRKWLGAQTYSEGLATLVSQVSQLRTEATPAKKHILIGHMAVEGTFFAEEEAELYTDNELMLPLSMFKQFDLTVLGHVHMPSQLASNPPVYYVGSMEKRGAFEKHNKVYAIVDTNDSIEFRKEPARDFLELVLDYSDVPVGQKLQEVVMDKLLEFAAENTISENIVKCSISILSEDVGFLQSDKLERKLCDFGAAFVFPINPSVFSTRKVRSSDITEQVSHAEGWTKFVKMTYSDEQLAAKMLAVGLDIISGASK